MTYPLLLSLLTTLACAQTPTSTPKPTPRSQTAAGFWDHWGDGQAEVVGYKLTQPRYGEDRAGEAVLIFVTETFTHGQRVKSDGGHPDEYPVIKLNEVRDFQTGIYDYNAMTSVFVPLSGELSRGLTSRVTFSMQEWCGHAYSDLLSVHALGAEPDAMELTTRTYFDGASHGPRALAVPAGGIVASALPVLVRGLVGELVSPGARRTVPYLPSVLDAHLLHEPLAWQEAELRRAAEPEPITTPIGVVSAWRYEIEPRSGPASTWLVEAAAPHRLLGWERSDGESGWITGSLRTAYWQQSGEGKEAMRGAIGLPVLARP
ncbi:MAG TPA: hypothetical protein DFR83_27680 [Deltaproteobacteria bacterium]|nr:hypothetical protein [Deltaproteobacteria bacterium]